MHLTKLVRGAVRQQATEVLAKCPDYQGSHHQKDESWILQVVEKQRQKGLLLYFLEGVCTKDALSMRQGQVTLGRQGDAIAGACRQDCRKTLNAADGLKLLSIFVLQKVANRSAHITKLDSGRCAAMFCHTSFRSVSSVTEMP